MGKKDSMAGSWNVQSRRGDRQSGVPSALLEAWCFGSLEQVPRTGRRHRLSYNLSMLEVVSPPLRMRKSDVGTESHLCECPGKERIWHLGETTSISLQLSEGWWDERLWGRWRIGP